MRRIAPTLVLGMIAVLSLGDATPAEAQGIGRRLRQRAEQKAIQRVENRAEQAMDKALDKTEDALVCAVTDTKCVEEAEKSGKQLVLTDEAANVVGQRGGGSGARHGGVGELRLRPR